MTMEHEQAAPVANAYSTEGWSRTVFEALKRAELYFATAKTRANTSNGYRELMAESEALMMAAIRAIPVGGNAAAAAGARSVPEAHLALLARLARHAEDCLFWRPLPTGIGTWHCTCGLDSLVLDGEYVPAGRSGQAAPSAASTEHAARRWIPCSERLPAKMQEVNFIEVETGRRMGGKYLGIQAGAPTFSTPGYWTTASHWEEMLPLPAEVVPKE